MSYCVNCGVELNPGADHCPLCGTPVVNPAQPVRSGEAPFFPPERAEVAPVSKKGLALLLSSMLLSLAACCGLLNLFLKPHLLWCLFPIGAAAMLWVWIVFPLLARKVPLWGRLTLDVAAIGVYVYLISLAVDGKAWFQSLAIPMLMLSMMVVFLLSWFMSQGHSRLTRTVFCLLAVAFFCLGTELFCDFYAYSHWNPGWSLVVAVCCLGLCIPLIVIRRVPSLREEARRRLHF